MADISDVQNRLDVLDVILENVPDNLVRVPQFGIALLDASGARLPEAELTAIAVSLAGVLAYARDELRGPGSLVPEVRVAVDGVGPAGAK